MSKEINLTSATKEGKYKELLLQVKGLLADETDLTANLANLCAAIKYGMNFFWVGFYLVKNDELVLGPFQGPVACTRIQKGKGVCGTAWQEAKTIVVEDVNEFPGHIACSTLSKSEIVVPLIQNDLVIGVLDIDSDVYKQFDATDAYYLEQMVQLIKF